MSEYAIRTKGLVVKQENFTLGPISLDIPKGSITCIVGRNGAGKTTLINTLLGRENVEFGGMSFGQYNYVEHEEEIRKLVATSDDLTVSNNVKLSFVSSKLPKIDSRFDNGIFQSYLSKFFIDPEENIRNLSLGTQKKISLFIALSLQPRILFLDEITANFDLISVNEILDVLMEYMEDPENTIIMSTNNISDVDMISDYIVFLKEGKVVEFNDLETLKHNNDTQSLEEIFVDKLGGHHNEKNA